ncbi:Pectinesterase inhibitor 5 [Cardamine amara subsp. amara]|uniref:Pectinesterase inhibitor 5 n=1 Tax=Cardamine amara subsp. amara TaxID=228776 RepID=A0ABD0Z9N0_CARAN
MATMLIKHINCLSLLVVVLLFAFPSSNAMPVKEIHSFCKETFELEFCMQYIGKNTRIAAARDLSDIFLIAISEAQIQMTNAITQIDRVRLQYDDPVRKNRLSVCEKKYESAGDSFHKAWEMGQKKIGRTMEDLEDMFNQTQAGLQAVSDCQDEWAKNGPKQESPLTLQYNNVQKLSQIARVIIKKITS